MYNRFAIIVWLLAAQQCGGVSEYEAQCNTMRKFTDPESPNYIWYHRHCESGLSPRPMLVVLKRSLRQRCLTWDGLFTNECQQVWDHHPANNSESSAILRGQGNVLWYLKNGRLCNTEEFHSCLLRSGGLGRFSQAARILIDESAGQLVRRQQMKPTIATEKEDTQQKRELWEEEVRELKAQVDVALDELSTRSQGDSQAAEASWSLLAMSAGAAVVLGIAIWGFRETNESKKSSHLRTVELEKMFAVMREGQQRNQDITQSNVRTVALIEAALSEATAKKDVDRQQLKTEIVEQVGRLMKDGEEGARLRLLEAERTVTRKQVEEAGRLAKLIQEQKQAETTASTEMKLLQRGMREKELELREIKAQEKAKALQRAYKEKEQEVEEMRAQLDAALETPSKALVNVIMTRAVSATSLDEMAAEGAAEEINGDALSPPGRALPSCPPSSPSPTFKDTRLRYEEERRSRVAQKAVEAAGQVLEAMESAMNALEAQAEARAEAVEAATTDEQAQGQVDEVMRMIEKEVEEDMAAEKELEVLQDERAWKGLEGQPPTVMG